jgi:tetratricopeptide (TPR) repeat protein
MSNVARRNFDFFLSRRGSVATVACEVADILMEKGYSVLVQDYDFPIGASFIEAMHEAIKHARDLIILFTRDYEESPYTRKEFTSFEAERLLDERERHVIVLRCEDVPLRGLLSDGVYQDLVGVTDPGERRRRIIAAAERHSTQRYPPRRNARTFVGVPTRIVGFTGREQELDQLDAILTSDGPGAVTQVGRAVVRGLGGVGKTTLAVEYANRFRNLYDGVWWCQTGTHDGIVTSLAALAVELKVASPEGGNIERAAQAALRHLGESREIWLLVYDNVAQPTQIADLLPAAGARVLITSRFSDWGEWADEVGLDVLPIADALAFLESRTGRTADPGAVKLAEALGRLPLALDHAAAYCRRIGMAFSDYAARAELLIMQKPLRGLSYQRSIAATFDLAIAEAVIECAAADPLMAYLAQCAPQRIPMRLIDGALDDKSDQTAAMLALAELSLIKYDSFDDGTPAISVHRLVQTVARHRAACEVARDRVLRKLAVTFPIEVSDPISWPLCAQLLPHLLATCSNTVGGLLTAELLDRAGSYSWEIGAYAQAKMFYERALASREQLLGKEHPALATSLNGIAVTLQVQNDLVGARALLERALAITEQSNGPRHLVRVIYRENLVGVQLDQKDFSAARECLEKWLVDQESWLGPEHPYTAATANHLAAALNGLGEIDRARSLYERALAIREKVLGSEHPDTATSLNNLGAFLHDQDDLTAARPLYERALLIREKVLGSQHPETALCLQNLGVLLHELGEIESARMLLERALAIEETVLGPEHPQTARTARRITNWFGKNVLYELHYAPDDGQKNYYICLVNADAEAEFLKRLQGSEPFDLTTYATVLASGRGDAPDALKASLRERYNTALIK